MIKRFAALVVLLGIIGGFPALLVASVGNPWPAGGVDELMLLSDAAVLGLIATLGWIVWAQLLLCAIVELPPALQNDTMGAAPVPLALGGQQRLMRVLVHTVLAVGVSSTTLIGAQTATAEPAASLTSTPSISPLQHSESASSTNEDSNISTASTRHAAASARSKTSSITRDQDSAQTVTTTTGDSLWRLAEAHLGDGFRWGEIASLNQGRTMPSGATFTDAGTIEAGWDIILPGPDTGPSHTHFVPRPGATAQTHLVTPGETLSGIAENTLGDMEDWPALYDVNADTIGGDPNLIQPGQILHLPTSTARPTSPQDTDSPQDATPSPRDNVGSRDTSVPDEGSASASRSVGNKVDLPHRAHDSTEAPIDETSDAESATADEAPDATQENSSVDSSDENQDEGMTALRALLATAACLSVSALAILANNRRRQFRNRRVGRIVTPPPPELAPVEQAIAEHGTQAQDGVVFLDRALRHVAASCRLTGQGVPDLAAAVLGDEDLTLLFATGTHGDAPDGWTPTQDARAWVLPRWTFLEADLEDQPAPYPALVSVGLDDGGRTWMLDLESHSVCGVGGDTVQVSNLVRFMVAELAVNAWSDGAEVLLGDDLVEETAWLNPSRVRRVERADAIARAVALIGDAAEAEDNLGADLLTRRRDSIVLDTTGPIVLVVPSANVDPHHPLTEHLSQRSRSRVVVLHPDEEAPAIELAPDGTAFLPAWGVTIQAFSLNADGAKAMADLLASTRDLTDQPMPETASDDGPLGKYARADGSLREEYTTPRRAVGEDSRSLLPDADEVYLATAATTERDLAAAAPSLSHEALAEIVALDPDLESDLEDWADDTSRRPKVQLLGPVHIGSVSGGDQNDITNLGGTVSFIAFLACQERGVTGERIADAFGWKTQGTVQNRATNARFLLGSRPDGTDWLPDASKTDGARRGTPTYQLERGREGVLVDADLFTRLRNRGQRKGAEGIQDLVRALALVIGAPFEASTDRRFPWLIGGQPHRDIIVAAVHDVAHIVATAANAAGDTRTVRVACLAARTASPHSDIAWLDEIAAAEAESGRQAADDLVRDHVVNSHDEDLPERTEQIADQRRWATG